MRPDVVRALLDRNEVPCDLSAALVALAPYSVLVTGARTLGTAICRLLAGQVEELHCCDHSEVALYEMAREVPPVCVYGATKHVCERLAYGFRGQAGLEVTVLRLVNLLGSSGSVLPIF